jgi:transcriptional regulator with XRE-family HTH domain
MTGEELKNWRKMLGITQEVAASKLGVARSTLAVYESEELQKRQGRPVGVPKVVENACNLVMRTATGAALLRIVREQHPDISEHVLLFGQKFDRIGTGPRFKSSDLAGHIPLRDPARFSLKPIKLGYGEYREIFDVPLIEFGDREAMIDFAIERENA